MPGIVARRFLTAVALLASVAQGAVTVTIDPATRYQTILGWGAMPPGWIEVPQASLREQFCREAVDEWGLTRLRLEPPSGNRSSERRWEWLNDNGDPEEVNWAALNTAALDKQVIEWVVPFKQRVEARGEPFNLYVSPSFFNSGSSGEVPAWLLHSPGEYAEFATTLLLRLKNTHGITADYYCILNEAGNNNPFTAAVVGEMIRTLGPKLEALGLETKIQFPECINANTSWSYIQALQGDADIWPHIGLLSYHLYGGNSARPSIRDFALAKGLPTAQTEYMGLTINDLYVDLVLGGTSYWEVYGSAVPSIRSFRTYLNDTTRYRDKQFWTLRQVMHYVRPGAVRIEATCETPAVRALAFAKDGKMTVVLINYPVPQTVNLQGLTPGTYGICQSVDGAVYEELGLRTVAEDGRLAVELAPNAVMTIYPHPGPNQAPTITMWKANPDYLTLPASSVTLSASATDPEQDALSYSWSLKSQPAGADAVLTTPDAASTSATQLTVPGEYVFTLAVSDGTHTVTQDVTLSVYAENQAPWLNDVHNRLPVVVTLPTNSTDLRAGADDLEGDPLTYRWSVVSQPAGAAAILTAPTGPRCRVANMTVPGDYVFRFEVSDPTHTVSELLKVTVYPENTAPVISSLAASPASITLPVKSTNLSATTSDPDGDTITHWWSVKSAPAAARPVFTSPGSANTVVKALTAPGTYVFTLAVIDRTKVTTRDVTVTVVEGLAGDVDGDGKVDLRDLLIAINAFGLSEGQAGFDERADLTGDAVVDMLDLLVVVYNFGMTR